MNPNTDTHNKDEKLTTNSFGNRVHNRKSELLEITTIGSSPESIQKQNPLNHDYTSYGSVRTSEKGSRKYKGK